MLACLMYVVVGLAGLFMLGGLALYYMMPGDDEY